jgi:hypothetical protein
MKKIITLLFSIFFLYSPSVFADDISDFEIEGISIGDSLLDYMSEDEILEEIENSERYYYLNEPNKFAEIYLNKGVSTYDNLSVFIKTESSNQYITNKNEKYSIQSIRGMITFIEDFDACMIQRDEILEFFPKIFQNTQKEEKKIIHSADPSGDSISDGVYFYFDSGALIYSACIDYEETFRIEKNWSDTLNVVIQTEEIVNWFRN